MVSRGRAFGLLGKGAGSSSDSLSEESELRSESLDAILPDTRWTYVYNNNDSAIIGRMGD